ncbi:ATPase [Methanococcus vannielii SB]|uniref:ATPase n=1 Tax=Methanococcus vannielii (strain ATCC 35089 / DSM 1224 / JCM 13029 / OCM 148 / SB) TaxID=406327 RepID=A6UNE4_METVS|nr:AAA family ATPase [Methanococcus vannielii]ABR54016.1 ATPase [Methanococcus vannielii SB]
MKINQISVKNLFDTIDHDIVLNDEGISIIHGVNGIGKTTFLKMIYSCFNDNPEKLKNFIFKEFNVHFEDNSVLNVLKNDDSIEYNFYSKTKKLNHSFKFLTAKTNIDDLKKLIGYFENSKDTNLADVLKNINLSEKKEEFPEWLKELLNSCKIYFIHTNRLNKISEYEKTKSLDLTVLEYSKDLVKKIEERLKKYGNLSEQLNKNFPINVIRCSIENRLSSEKITEELVNLDKRREKFVNLGILDPNDDAIIDPDEEFDLNNLKIDESDRDLFSVYLRDANKKLDVFEDLSVKLELLKRMVNSKFIDKELVIDQKEGFVFKSSNGKILTPSNLSSGEQHEIILLYELLFNINANSVVLIDEPELSLHVSWQQQFLRDLIEINAIKNFEIIIATHSPQIIHNRWDLTVGLGDDEEDEEYFEGDF